MGNVLIIAEHAAGHLKKATLSAVAFGNQMAEKTGGNVQLLVMGSGLDNIVEQLQGCGADTIHVADHEALAHYQNETYAAVVAQVADAVQAEMIAAPSSTMTKDMLPRVACSKDAAMISECLGIVSATSFKRPMWAGNAVATVEVSTPTKVATVRATEFDPVPTDGAQSQVNQVAVIVPDDIKCIFEKFDAVLSERPDLTEAGVVVSGGRGVKGEEGIKLIEALADKFNAAVGWTRAVVDAGWAPNDLQVGQTGKIVAPDLYVAVALSGAIQHLAGMKGSKVIVAINKNPDEPIFQVADYGLVADMFKAVPEFLEEIDKVRAG